MTKLWAKLEFSTHKKIQLQQQYADKKATIEQQYADDKVFADSFKQFMAKQKLMYEDTVEQYRHKLVIECESNKSVVQLMAAEMKMLIKNKMSTKIKNDKLQRL